MIYLIGSLRQPFVPQVAKALRDAGHDVFDDWHACGPNADDAWRDYEMSRGRSFTEALDAPFAWHAFKFDQEHIKAADTGVLVLPAGKSGHLELGYMAGLGKRTFILLDDQPDRYELMYLFADKVCPDLEHLLEALR